MLLKELWVYMYMDGEWERDRRIEKGVSDRGTSTQDSIERENESSHQDGLLQGGRSCFPMSMNWNERNNKSQLI